jgi:sugar O-acyltransferase (sialic acid O-acetyltransferase NeuD family)
VSRIVLYAVGSPLVVDLEEACLAAGIGIAAAVRNHDGPVYLTSDAPVVSPAELTEALRDRAIAVGMFTPGNRKRAYDEAWRNGFRRAATVVHPASTIARSTVLGSGVFVNAGCVVGGACRIADRALLNRSVSIGHHGTIGEYASIGPGAVLAGNVSVGRGAVIGAGSVILPEVEIGDNAVIAAGSVVRRPVPAHALAEGHPARVVRTGIAGYKGLAV